MASPYRILSLDGGGSWALIQAKCLVNLYSHDTKGWDVLKDFELVIANSGGSMVAAGLANNYTLGEIEALLMSEEKRKKIFVKLSFFQKKGITKFTSLINIGPRYSALMKKSGLEGVLGNIKGKSMEDLAKDISAANGHTTHFMISTFDYDRNRAVFMRSDRNSNLISWKIRQNNGDTTAIDDYRGVTLVDAVHAASNAPLNYFDEPAKFTFVGDNITRYYWDGAVGGYNNPVMAGVLEAVCNGQSAEDIRVLSIGTGTVFLPMRLPGENVPTADLKYVQERVESSFLNDLPKMTESILDDPPDSANFTAYAMLYPKLPSRKPTFIRMNPVIRPVKKEDKWDLPPGLPDPAEFHRLVKMDMDAIENDDVFLISKLANEWIKDNIPNQPIRMGGKELDCIIGHETFGQAKNRLGRME